EGAGANVEAAIGDILGPLVFVVVIEGEEYATASSGGSFALCIGWGSTPVDIDFQVGVVIGAAASCGTGHHDDLGFGVGCVGFGDLFGKRKAPLTGLVHGWVLFLQDRKAHEKLNCASAIL